MSAAPVLHLRLDGYEGPLELLLELARAQKVDLARLSIVDLVDQYLAVIAQARATRLELAADWLVMAATLAWLRSRLLLPEAAAPDPDATALAEALTDRLAELACMRAAAAWLGARPQLGRAVFARGAPESLTRREPGAVVADLPGLLRAYLAARRRGSARAAYAPPPRRLWTVAAALGRLEAMLGVLPGWAMLGRFLPEGLADPVEQRAAMAATLIAALEVARGGGVELRQDRAFGPILLRRAEVAARAA